MSAISDAPALLAVLSHIGMWQSTEGAAEWLREVYDAGPRVRYDNSNLGDGPVLRLATDIPSEFRRCPSCRRKTEAIELDIVLSLSDDTLIDFAMPARRCASCELVSVDFADLQQRLTTEHPGLEHLEFVPLGYIPDSGGSTIPKQQVDEASIRERMRPFSRIDDGDWYRTAWPTLEDQQRALERVLREAGISDLLGPLTLPGQGFDLDLRP
jgi:hypothetical protein